MLRSALPKGEWLSSFCCIDQWFHIKKKKRQVLLQVLDNLDMKHLDLEWVDRSQAFYHFFETDWKYEN